MDAYRDLDVDASGAFCSDGDSNPDGCFAEDDVGEVGCFSVDDADQGSCFAGDADGTTQQYQIRIADYISTLKPLEPQGQSLVSGGAEQMYPKVWIPSYRYIGFGAQVSSRALGVMGPPIFPWLFTFSRC